MESNRNLFIVSISGAIGSGKSTLIEELKALVTRAGDSWHGLRVIFFDEPVQTWIDEGWLETFYAHRKRWALAFQLRILQGQIEAMQRIKQDVQQPTLCICERSPLDGLHVFASMLHEAQELEPLEYALYASYAQRAWTPHVNVLVDIDTQLCVERVRSRGRKEEQDSAYIARVVQQYKKAFAQCDYRFENSGTKQDLERFAEHLLATVANGVLK